MRRGKSGAAYVGAGSAQAIDGGLGAERDRGAGRLWQCLARRLSALCHRFLDPRRPRYRPHPARRLGRVVPRQRDRGRARRARNGRRYGPLGARDRARRLDRIANHRIAAAPLGFMPKFLADAARSYKLEDGTSLVDKFLMVKLPGELDVLRRAAKLADEGYKVFREAAVPGRAQFELIAEIEAFFRSRGCPDHSMIMGSGGQDVMAMAPPSERRIAKGDLVTTELTPAVQGYFAQICRTLVV